jgi:putative peptidoglycan lipid II flippase
MGDIVSIFMLGLLPFTLFYVLLRGFYSLEDTRTPFFVTVAFSAVMLVLVLMLFSALTNLGVTNAGGPQVAAIALGYVLAYWFGLALLWLWLALRLGGLQTPRTIWVLIRLVFAGIASVAIMAIIRANLISLVLPDMSAQLTSAITIVVVGAIGAVSFLFFAWLARVHEVSSGLRMIKSKVMRS